jgi:hypothetical protein
MLKTISAAFLAASVIAAPAFAMDAGKTATAPVIKADQTQTKTTAAKPVAGVKADAKSKAMNANAAVTPDEHKTVRSHRHHHKHLASKHLAKKSVKAQPDASKPVGSEKRS